MKPKVLAFLVVLCLGFGLLAVADFSASGKLEPKVGSISEYPTLDAKHQTEREDVDPEVGTIIQSDEIGSDWFAYYPDATRGESNPVTHQHLSEAGIAAGPEGYYRIEEPPHWYHPPIKVAPNGSRIIIFKVFSIGTEDLIYSVVSDHPCILANVPPTSLPPGDSVEIAVLLDGTGACNGTFIAGNVILTTNEGGGTMDYLRVHVVVAEDYYECPRDPATVDTVSNEIIELRVNANCQQEIHDIGTRPDTTFQTFFRGGTIVATTQDGDTLVGRFMGENDWRAGAQDKLYTEQCDVDWEPDFWLLYTKDIYIEASHLAPPNHLKWWWWEISKQIKIFKPGAPEVYRHIVIKYVTVKRQDPPGWWPDLTPFTNYEDTYIGFAMDINCPWDSSGGGEPYVGDEAAVNLGEYDELNRITYQVGFGRVGEHPEYNNYHAGLALAEVNGVPTTTPYGVDIVKNNQYLYPTTPWGWKDGELYQLAKTPGVYIQDPDSLVDRSIVLTASMIPAGDDALAEASFTLIEALAPNGLAQLQEYVDSARAIVAREREHGIPALCGDVDGDGDVDQEDVDYLVAYLEESGPAPPCPIGRADVNGDGVIDTGDVATLEDYLDNGGALDCPGIPPPPPPLACYADGDANNDAVGLTSADLVYLDNFINACGPAPIPLYSCDLNGDGYVDPADLQLYSDYFVHGISVFDPYGGYPVLCPCDPIPAPVPDTVHIFGLEHSSLGMSCLEIVDDTLKVTRLGSSGDDGVTTHLPNAIGWDCYTTNFDSGHIVPIGGMIEVMTTGTIDGEPDQFVVSLRNTKIDDSIWVFEVISEANSYLLEAFFNGELVYQQAGFTGNSRTNTTKVGEVTVVDAIILQNDWLMDGPYWVRSYNGEPMDYAAFISIEGGPDNLGIDEIRLTPENMPGNVTAYSSISMKTVDIPSIVITSESYWFNYGDVIITNLGNAILTIVDTTLVVSNICSSGDDGIGAEAQDDDGDWAIVVANPDPSGTLPVGASLETQFFFFIASQPDSFSMGLSMTKAAVNTWDLAVESEATIYTIEAFYDTSSVFSVVDNATTGLGYIVETAKGVYPVGYNGASTNKPASVVVSSDYDFTASPDGVQWTWPAHGVSNLQIDSLSISTEVFDTSLVGVTHATICGANGAKSDPISFTILDIQVEPPFMRGDANGDAIINIGDVVYLVSYLYRGGPEPSPVEAGDANCDGIVNVGDIVYLVSYLYRGGPPPGC